MYRRESLDKYVADAAAKKPAPGGGSVSALAAALAASMSEMVANFTVGKKKYAEVEDEMRRMLGELGDLREQLLDLVERDVEAYSAVSEAYGMPKGTDGEKAARGEAIDRALRGAMEVPLQIMRRCADVAGAAGRIAEAGNPNLITDAGVSAILSEAACASAALNVEINLKFLKDEDLAERTRAEMERLTRRVEESRDEVSRRVADHLSQ